MCRPHEISKSASTSWMTLSVLCTTALGTPPLPTHQIDGNTGVCITPTAYFANPAEANEVFGRPSISGTYASVGEKDFEAFVITENLWGRAEIGYSLERISLGEWPGMVREATGLRVRGDASLHNFNARALILQEDRSKNISPPAINLGAHLKYQQDLDEINEQLGGTCDTLGADHDTGIEFTVTATKTIAHWLPRPLIVSAALRNGDAVQTGLLGFAGERRTTFEGSVIYFLTDRLLIAAEYRQKPNLIQPCTVGGAPLVKPENDWWDVCLGYIVNDHITVAGGYANFGNVLNNREDNVWAVQVKYEF